MTIIPAVLVLIVGSELIRNSVDRWFNAPMDEVLSSPTRWPRDMYQERQQQVAGARPAAGEDAGVDRPVWQSSTQCTMRSRRKSPPIALALVEVYRVVSRSRAIAAAGRDVRRRTHSAGLFADRCRDAGPPARRAGGPEVRDVEPLPNGGELIRAAVPIQAPGLPVRGVVIASELRTGQFATRARRMTSAYEAYQQLRVLKQPLAGVYLSFFLMLTLMILVSATWMGLYVAKRITRPVQMLAIAAREIGAGHLDHRVEPETSDEFGSLMDAFNRMAADIAASRRQLEQSSVELQNTHEEVEGRRRYVETILERIATGVISVDPSGRIRTWNSAASRLLGIDVHVSGLPAAAVFGSPELKPLAALLDQTSRKSVDLPPQDVSITRDGRELHLAVMTTPLRRDDGGTDGTVIVFDDVSPLIRAQKVAAWREVARRLAHEIKNPLTPIQLCCRAAPPSFQQRRGADAGAGRGVHDHHRWRGRITQGPGGRVLAIRAHAGAARRTDRSPRPAR